MDERDRRRPRVVTFVIVIAIVLAVWAAAVVVTGLLAYRDLEAARDAVTAAEAELREVELASARSSLGAAADRATAASRRLHWPHLAPLRIVPVVGSNLYAVTTLSDAVRDTASAAEELLAAGQQLLGEEPEASGSDTDGRLPADDLASLAPLVRHLADTLARTTEEVDATASRWLLEPVFDARGTYLEVVDPRVEQMSLAADAAEVLPTFLGADGPRRYLVAAASLSELRAAGGLLGSWTVLTAEDGELSFGEFAGIDDLESPDGAVPAPSESYARRYADRGALRFWRNANFSPDFPSAAQVWLEMWEAVGRRPLDGVVMVDAVTFEQLVQGSGPIEVAGVTTLEPDETVEFVGLEAYAAFDDSDERKQVLGAVATSAFGRVVDALSGGDLASTIAMLGELTEGGHLQVFSREPAVQDVITRAGLAGRLPEAEGEFAGVFVSNLAANKVDYFTERHIEHRVRLLPDGAVSAAVDVEFHNLAPRDGYPRHVLGPWVEDVEAGDNVSHVTFACGRACEFSSLGEAIRPGGTERGLPVADVRLRVPAGERRRVEYRTTTDDAWDVEGGDIVVTVDHRVQPTLHGSTLRVVLDIPEGFEPVDPPEEVRVDGDELAWEQLTSGDVRLRFRLRDVRPEDRPEGS